MSTKAELLGCIAREIRFRERVYPRMIERGRMTKAKASYELELMKELREFVATTMPDDVDPQPSLFGGSPDGGRRA